VLIRSVMPGEPAEKGGIKANDVITAIDGTTLNTPRDLQRIVSASPVGKRIKVLVLREGKPSEVEVEIGRYKEPDDKR
jgi:serine protease Do